MSASMMGKEAGMFVPSGTMGNLAAILAHCGRGDEAILGHLSHTFLFEAGGAAALGGVSSNLLMNQPDGTLNLDEIDGAVRADDPHCPISRLVILENTHNRCGGVALTVDYTNAVAELAHRHGLKFHLDGARIFNAAAVMEADAKDLAAPTDSVTFCLSKGLGAPVGSVLCGTAEFVSRARRMRKQLGGGMRQAGVLAAAGIIALETMIARLPDDHKRASRLAEGLAQSPGLEIDPGSPFTNMVFFTLGDQVAVSASDMAGRLKEKGLLVGVTAERRFRLVTHYMIGDSEVDSAINIFREVLQASMI
jgi:threonine aldolase